MEQSRSGICHVIFKFGHDICETFKVKIHVDEIGLEIDKVNCNISLYMTSSFECIILAMFGDISAI